MTDATCPRCGRRLPADLRVECGCAYSMARADDAMPTGWGSATALIVGNLVIPLTEEQANEFRRRARDDNEPMTAREPEAWWSKIKGRWGAR